MRTLAMALPVGYGDRIAGVRVAVVAEMRTGIVLADVFRHDAAAGLTLSLVPMPRV